jgi:tetratricopeptide (TPR) repeat protein
LKTATELNPKSAEFYMEMSRVLRDLGKANEQKAALATAVRLDPNFVEARYALANLARQTGDTAASREQFAKVQQLRQDEVNRDLAQGEIRAGVLLAGKRDFDAAIERFRKAIAIDPKLGEAHFDLAGALLEKGDARAAIPCFRQAIALAPAWAEAHYQLGRALLQTGERDEAMGEFRTALKNDPEHAGARLALQ